jgi:hypothetical protein
MDSERFMPYNYNMLILWGIVSSILFLTFEGVAKISIIYAVIYITFIFLLFFTIEKYFTSKENEKYDLNKSTKIQKFVESVYTFAVFFAIFLTYIFVTNDMLFYSYIVWIFLIGFSDYIIGFILNNIYFTIVGMINMVLVFAILTLSFVFGIELFEQYIKYIAVLFSSFGCIYLGIKSKKKLNV